MHHTGNPIIARHQLLEEGSGIWCPHELGALGDLGSLVHGDEIGGPGLV